MMSDKKQDNTSSDDYLQRYLEQVDFQQLDLNHIDLKPDTPKPIWNWLRLLGCILCIVALMWQNSSGYEQIHPEFAVLAYVVWFTLLLLGVSVLRWLWPIVMQHYVSFKNSHDSAMMWVNQYMGEASLRWLTLLLALVCIGTVLLLSRQDGDSQRVSNSSYWLVSFGLAIAGGTLLGRWLIMHAESKPVQATMPLQLNMPPWLKWFNLVILICGGLFASLGHYIINNESESMVFLRTGIGFVVGTMGAIWIARRFDEVETDMQKKRYPYKEHGK